MGAGEAFILAKDSHPMVRATKNHYARYGEHSMPIMEEAERIYKILGTMMPIRREMPSIRHMFRSGAFVNEQTGEIRIFQGARQGTAYPMSNKIVLWGRASWHTLAHEMVHIVLPPKTGHDRLFYETLRTLIEKRWKIEIRVSDITARYGYAWDDHFEKQYEHLTETAWPKQEIRMISKQKPTKQRKPQKQNRISAFEVEDWMRDHVGEWKTIAEICEATGAAHMTVRKVGKEWLRPKTARGLYEIIERGA